MSARLLLLVALALPPRIAPACAVCFSGRDESRTAYIFTTVLLSALPLICLGGFVFWIVRRSRAQAREIEQQRQTVASPASRG